MKMAIVILVAVLLLAGSLLIWAYNLLVRLRQNVHEAWSAIDTELQRRHDLVPALVETVKGYAAHEKQTLEAVIAARNAAAADHGPVASQAQHQGQLVEALRRLMAVVEAYPDLKASSRFLDLQHQLVETEDRLSKARRFYNANVRELNTAAQAFPLSLVAGRFGFEPQPYFEVEETARKAPAVKMG
jgi:LemA protein